MVDWKWFFFSLIFSSSIFSKVTKLIFRYKTWLKFPRIEILINFLEPIQKCPTWKFNQIHALTRNFHSFHLQWFIFHFRTITFLSHSFTRRWCQALIEKHPCRSPARNKRINTQKCTSCSMCEWEPRGEHKILIGYFYILDIIHRQLRQWCFFKSRTAVCDALHMMNLYNVHNPNYSSVFPSLYYFNIVVMQCNKNKTKSEFHRFAEHFHTHFLWQIHSFRVFLKR